jgi:hypothetical protein
MKILYTMGMISCNSGRAGAHNKLEAPAMKLKTREMDKQTAKDLKGKTIARVILYRTWEVAQT